MYFDIKKLYYTTSIGCYGFVSKFKILKQNMICFSFEGGGYTFMGMYLHGTVTANRMGKRTQVNGIHFLTTSDMRLRLCLKYILFWSLLHLHFFFTLFS